MTSPSVTPEGKHAHRLVFAAVRRGSLLRQPCEVCGDRRTDAHHRLGYGHPLEVAWLCRRHHFAEHDNQHVVGDNSRRVTELAASGLSQAAIGRGLGLSRQRVHQILHPGPDGRGYLRSRERASRKVETA